MSSPIWIRNFTTLEFNKIASAAPPATEKLEIKLTATLVETSLREEQQYFSSEKAEPVPAKFDYASYSKKKLMLSPR